MNRIRDLREKKGMTQDHIAKYLNVKRNTISRYENNEREPDNNTLQKLADFFDVTTDYLLGRSDTPTQKQVIPATIENKNLKELILNSDELSEEGKQDMLRQLALVKIRDNAKANNEFGNELEPEHN